MDELLSIGALAERCGLSRSALRFYDQCGVLRPAAVDEATGYRYYEPAQVEVADLVRRLRGAEVGVEAVKAFLAAGAAERRDLLVSYRAGVEGRLALARTILDELERSMTKPESSRPPQWAVPAPMFSSALGQVLFAVSDDRARPELAGVLVEGKDGSLRLVATDRYRLAINEIVVPEAAGAASVRALISPADIAALRPRLAVSQRCVLRPGRPGGLDIDLDGDQLALSGLAEEFPDYDRVLLGLPPGHHCLVSRPALADAFGHGDGDLAQLCFARPELQVEIGGVVSTVASDWAGPRIELLLNTNFVAEALAAHTAADIVVEVAAPLQPVTFRAADAGTFSVLVMPVRPRDQAAA